MPDIANPPERHNALNLPDGRSLAWAEWGPEAGRPVIFCTGAGMSGSLGFGAADLAPLGLRLLAIDRPGLGRSAPHPDKTLATWAADIAVLITDCGLDNLCAVGFSQGAPFALSLAAAGLVTSVTLVSGQDDLAHPALLPQLPPQVAGMIAAIRDDAAAFEKDFAKAVTAKGLHQLVIDMSCERDRALYQSPVFAEAYRRCLEEGFDQGPAGYVRDLVNAVGPWPFRPEDIAVPVDLWYGALDTSPVHSPDFGATLATRLTDCTRSVHPEEGGSILWTRAGDILRRIAAH